MPANELDYVVGVDPHRDRHALAIVEVWMAGVVFEASLAANSRELAGEVERYEDSSRLCYVGSRERAAYSLLPSSPPACMWWLQPLPSHLYERRQSQDKWARLFLGSVIRHTVWRKRATAEILRGIGYALRFRQRAARSTP